MKLMTKAIATALIKADKALVASGMEKEPDKIVVKYFNPVGAATWYITSATPLDADGEPDYEGVPADWHMFGYADLGHGPGMAELGYVMFSELEAYKGPLGLGIERDRYYSGTLKDVMAKAA